MKPLFSTRTSHTQINVEREPSFAPESSQIEYALHPEADEVQSLLLVERA